MGMYPGTYKSGSFVRPFLNGDGLKLFGGTSGYISFAPAATSGSQAYTLPSAYPASDGYVLSSTTGGEMSWIAPGGGSAAWESSSGQFRAKPASVTAGDYFYYNPSVANSGSNAAHVFDNSVTLSGSTKLASWKNNTTEKAFLDYNGNIRFGKGFSTNEYRSVLGADSLSGMYVGDAGGQSYVSLINNLTSGYNLYLNRAGYGYIGFGSPYAFTGSVEMGGVGALASLDGQCSGDYYHGTGTSGDSGFTKSAASGGNMDFKYDNTVFFRHDGTDLVHTLPAATGSFVVRNAAAQSDHAQKWQNSAGTTLAYMDNAGELAVASQVTFGTSLLKDQGTRAYIAPVGSAFDILTAAGDKYIFRMKAESSECVLVNGASTYNYGSFVVDTVNGTPFILRQNGTTYFTADGTTLKHTSPVTNSGTNVGHIFDTGVTLSGNTLLASFRNNTSEKLAIADNGALNAGNGTMVFTPEDLGTGADLDGALRVGNSTYGFTCFGGFYSVGAKRSGASTSFVWLDIGDFAGTEYDWSVLASKKLVFDASAGSGVGIARDYTAGDTYFTKSTASGGDFSYFYDGTEILRDDGSRLSLLASRRPGLDAAIGTSWTVFDGTPWTQSTAVTVVSTATETTLLGTGVGTKTIPASRLRVGSAFTVALDGVMSTKAAVTGTLRIRAKIGSVTIWDSGEVAVDSSMTNMPWELVVKFTVRAIGSGTSANVIASGVFAYSDGTTTKRVPVSNTAVSSGFDSTATQAIDVTADWETSDASNSITAHQGSVREQN